MVPGGQEWPQKGKPFYMGLIFSRNIMPILITLRRNHPWVKGILNYSNKG
jgi:hypothetical protein